MELNAINYTGSRGINTANRERLTRLVRATEGPFTVAEASQVLNMTPAKSRRFLAYLAARGWLARVRPGLYVAVPLDASEPSQWRADPWVIAAELFAPCYIGGWSACEYWGLTDQLFRDVAVMSGRWTRDRTPMIQGTSYRVRVISPERLFGTRVVWRGRVQVQVADSARTILDVLDDPGLGGGIRHVGDVVLEWFAGDLRDDGRLLEYVERLGNRSVYKRLGFLIETLALSAPDVLEVCERRMSSGTVRLDPTGPPGGRRVPRWNLMANASLGAPKP